MHPMSIFRLRPRRVSRRMAGTWWDFWRSIEAAIEELWKGKA